MVIVPTLEDAYARMDRLEQRMKQVRVSDRGMVCDDFDGLPMASLLAKFRMPEIERYTGIGYPRIHLRLYSTVMRAHGLDEAQMIMLFPMSLTSRPPPQPMPLNSGLINFGQPSVTMNSLSTHTTYSVPPPTGGIHRMDFVQDDVIHMLSWDDGLPEMIVLDDGYEIVGVT
ncbi:hypothetical protein CK203_037957 [Vitis vinifera]|uniref:Uncharacterized protein n=1 Tax=Vitis vinifera TaxID=29760 RepID=A0A438HNV7_VITVI|nr:hypothetical protein CK203_037957 [Vitis vinifera]